MNFSQDYRDLFKIFNDHSVRFLIVGAYAVMFYTEPRFTKDIDVWIDPEEKNAHNVYKALAEFGVPLTDVTPDDFMDVKLVYQIGVAPVRIDILPGMADLFFEKAWKNKTDFDYDGIPVYILGIQDLITAKKAAGRDQDKLDLKKLSRFLHK